MKHTLTLEPLALAHMIAALSHYRTALLEARTTDPFNFKLLESLAHNDVTRLAVRDALNSWGPAEPQPEDAMKCPQNPT